MWVPAYVYPVSRYFGEIPVSGIVTRIASGFTENENFRNEIEGGALGLIRKPFNADEQS